MKDALALALVHFLWQGALLGVLGWGLMRLGRTASVRYVIGVVTLVAMFAAPVITFGVMAARVPTVTTAPTGSPFATPTGTPTLRSQVLSVPPTTPASSIPVLPTTWILAAWLLGVSLLSARVAGGWVVARRLATTGVTPLADELAEVASALALRMGIHRGVRVLVSSRAVVPMMLGWWRPVVLLPFSTISGLPLRQLEALLAHEFAHIRRHDYLVNLMQTFIETMCFYHPAVWLVSREVRRERELCCDDIGVATCDRVTYVIALARVAEIASPQLALAASGGSLRDRIRRLVLPSAQPEPSQGGWLLLLPVICLLALAVPQAMPSQAPRPTIQNPVTQEAPWARADAEAEAGLALAKDAVAQGTMSQREYDIRRQSFESMKQSREETAAYRANPSSWGRPIGATEVLEKPFLVEVTIKNVPGYSDSPIVVRDADASGVGDLNPIYYTGYSPDQVQAQIRKLIADKNLSSDPTVTVTARRPPDVAPIQVAPAQTAPAPAVGTPSARQVLADLREHQKADLETKGQLEEQRRQLQVPLDGYEAEAQRVRALFARGLATKDAVDKAEHRGDQLAATVKSLSDQIAHIQTRTAATDEKIARIAGSAVPQASALTVGDILIIAIVEEPLLPREYEVARDGSIRFPVLGKISVTGHTAAQVSVLLADRLTALQPGSQPHVTVSAIRPVKEQR